MRKILVLTAILTLSACGLFQSARLPSKAGITPGESITVQGNQNIYAVARANNVSMRELIVLNDLHSPFTLRSGQRLTLPANKTGGGDNYYSSSSYTSSYEPGSLAPTPMAAPSSTIETTSLPPIQPASVQSETLPPPPKTAKPTQVEALNAPSTPAKPVTTTIAGSKTAPTPVEKSSDAPSAPVTFKWPVQGPVLSGFGPKGQGLSNDGVNIGAPKGAPVVASANGIVVYAGNEMKGFGNLVLIRHSGGWVTAYAHLDRALVSKDAVVAQGDMIGTVGKTGNVPSPQLHFEIRYQGKPVDPAGEIKGE